MKLKIRSFLITAIIFSCYYTAQSQDNIIIGRLNSPDGKFQLTGKVLDNFSNEPIIGANIYIENTKQGVASDTEGEFLLDLKKGNYLIKVSAIGYENRLYSISLNASGKFNFRLKETSLELNEVVISEAKADQNVQSTDMGKNVLTLETIKTLPALIGEIDVLKSITLLPGITSTGEASSGFNVRGGGGDQNLILIGKAPLYNPSHLFGFFSAFNSNLVRSVDVYKGGIPAKFGGRGSSIIDIKYRRGNSNFWASNATLGLISSNIDFEGPIINNKLSILGGGRISHINWALKSIDDVELKQSRANFYDGTAILHYNFNKNNQLSYTYYQSNDRFKFAADTTYSWQNRAHVLSWQHIFNDQLSSELSLIRSEYDYNIENVSNINPFEIISKIKDTGIQFELVYMLNDKHSFSGGIHSKMYQINPGELIPDNNSEFIPIKLQEEKGVESSIYFQHDWRVNDKLSLTYGIRANNYAYLGDIILTEYQSLAPINENNIVGFTSYKKNEVVTDFNHLAPRASLKYSLNQSTSVKAGYNKMYQYIHLISNTNTIAPTDVWRLSSPFLKPKEVTQYSIGIFKNLKNNSIEVSTEFYYKDMKNVVDYKDGAELILNGNIETELILGEGRAYGGEFYIKKNSGRMTGWFSYTYSRSEFQMDGLFPEDQINGGDWYPANFDKPHDMTVVYNYKIKKNLTFSSIFNYSTGRPATFPVAKYNYFGDDLPYFVNRNLDRVPNYHRLDLSLTFKIKSKMKAFQGDWTLSVYNVYGRKNAFSVYFDDVFGAPPQAYSLAIIGIPIPALSYSFKLY